MARYLQVNDIINRTAVECGLEASSSPVTSLDQTFVQLVQLLNSAGQELCELHNWQILRQVIDVTLDSASALTLLGDGVTVGTSGIYTLPDDFNSMINQTGWDRTNQVAIGGPLSAQNWTYLVGRDLVSQTIYATFRLTDGKLEIFPQPAPDGLRLSFEYESRNWLITQGATLADRDTVGTGADTCVLDPLMTIKFLKLKWLAAKGFDIAMAALEFDTIFNTRVGKSTGAPVLSASRSGAGYPYLDAYRNTGDTGYGGI